MRHLAFQGVLDEPLRQLLQNTVLAENLLRLLARYEGADWLVGPELAWPWSFSFDRVYTKAS